MSVCSYKCQYGPIYFSMILFMSVWSYLF